MEMRLLADANIYQPIVQHLKGLGHDVFYLGQELKPLNDEEVLNLAINEKRILLTFDLDFSDIRFLPKIYPGIIILRFKKTPVKEINQMLEKLFNEVSKNKMKNSLIIVGHVGWRIRLGRG